MSTHKHIDRICVVITVLSLLLTVAFMNGRALGIEAASREMGYESTLFDTSKVHSIDIVIDDWDAFVQTAASEEYSPCSVVIDNKAVKNVAIRGKGNTSLSTVASMGSNRYSFKLEFDHYESGKSCKGLDKLCLNNCIQDNTYMKDYLAYRMMAEFGADAPLCSYAWVTVNGEPWGLYLAVEGIEDSFMERLYGGEGELYKPDSMSMGGGPGNGRDFDMNDFMDENAENMGVPWSRDSDEDQTDSGTTDDSESAESAGRPRMPGGMQPPEGMELPEGMERPEMPEGMERPEMPGGKGGGPGGFGMGSSDVKLQYTDDDPDSYANIFDNAKTTVTEADRKRLIRSLKALSEGEDLEEVLDIDGLLRYFVVHNYLVNSDSYTGSMIHNYYLREAGGQLSMIPWDYNLAFGTFQNGDASSAVNDPIDTPLSVSGDGSRPIADWIFRDEEYTELYHQYFAEFLETVDVSAMIEEAYSLIAPYVEKDPTAFCTYEEFETGVDALRSFCEKRTLSVQGQLDGTIPTTDEGQQADPAALIETDGLELSDMGTMGGGPGDGSFQPPDMGNGNFQPPSGGDGNFQPPNMGDGNFQPPGGGNGNFQPPDMGNGNFQPQQGKPSGFDPGSTPGFPGQTATKSIPWLPLALSALALTAGLLTAWLYRRNC